MNNAFSYDDFRPDTSSSVFGKLVLASMLIVFAAASMLTTYSFFAVYAPGLGQVLHPAYAGQISGLLGVLLFDCAGLGWTVLRSRDSDTSEQFVIATVAAVATISLALLTSALYVVLASSFDVGLYTATGELSSFGQTMQAAGVITMTLGFVLNFGAISTYVNTSAGVTSAVQQTQLAAYANAGRFKADRARAELVTHQTLQSIMAELPDRAALAGQENGAGYLNRAFAQGFPTTAESKAPVHDVDDQPEETTARPSLNENGQVASRSS